MKSNGMSSPGVFIIKGRKGIKVGHSKCPKRRVPRIEKEQESYIGEIEQVCTIPMNDRKVRIRLKKDLIDIFKASSDQIKVKNSRNFGIPREMYWGFYFVAPVMLL